MKETFEIPLKQSTGMRKVFFLLCDFFIIVISLYSAFLIRFKFAVPGQYILIFFRSLPIFVAIKLIIFGLFGLYRITWRYVTIGKFIKIYVSLAAAESIVMALILIPLGLHFSFFPLSYISAFPRSIFFIDALAGALLLSGLRISYVEVLLCKEKHGVCLNKRLTKLRQMPEQWASLLRVRYLYVFAVSVALATSLVYLRVSQAIGRLSQDITYDDISYVNDAVSRLIIGYKNGLIDFIITFANNPPHSPFSTLLACLALIVGGYNDIALYASNSILLVAVAVFLVWLFKEAGPGTVVWIIMAFLSSPLAYCTIHDFRPDITLGFMTAVMVYFFAVALYRDSRYFTFAGIVLGACLLIKPVFFAHTLALGVGLVILHLILCSKWAAFISTRIAIPRRTESIRFLLTGLLVALPYFVINAKNIFLYFWTNTRGENSSIWSFSYDKSLFVVAKIFLLGNNELAANRLAGIHAVVMVIAIMAGLGVMAYRQKLKELLISLTLVYSALISFLIIIVGRHKNEFFLAPFYSLLFVAGFFSVAYISREVGRADRRVLLVVAWLTLGVTIYGNRSLVHWHQSAEANVFNSWNSKVVTAIADDMSHNDFTPSEKVKLFVAMAGPVNAHTIKWIATKRGVNLDSFDLCNSAAIDDFVNAAKDSHYVLVPNESRSEYYRWLASGTVQSKFLISLRNDPRFRQISSFSVDDAYYLFANRDMSAPIVDIEGISSLTGLGPTEGPYPQWLQPRLRWMTDSEATLCFEVTSPGRYTATLRYRPETDGSLSITDKNGKLIKNNTFKTNVFAENVFTVYLPTGNQCLNLSAQMGRLPYAKHFLLFTKIALRKSHE
jgi:hypothetical protein